MTEPSPELVEEIARVISLAEIEATEQGVRPVDEHVFLARAVLSSASIARALDGLRLLATIQPSAKSHDVWGLTDEVNDIALQALGSTPQATGLSAIAQERDETAKLLVLDFLRADAAYRRDLGIYGAHDQRTVSSERNLWWAKSNMRGWYARMFGTDELRDVPPPVERSEIGEGASPEAVTTQSSLPPAQDDSA